VKRRIIKLPKITITLSEIIIKFGVTWWEASFAVRLFLLPAWVPTFYSWNHFTNFLACSSVPASGLVPAVKSGSGCKAGTTSTAGATLLTMCRDVAFQH